MKLPEFYGTRRFIVVYTIARPCPLLHPPSYFSKILYESTLIIMKTNRLMRSPCCVCVCVSVSACVSPDNTFVCLNRSLLNSVCISCQLRPTQRCINIVYIIIPSSNTNTVASQIVEVISLILTKRLNGSP
jgi:hypothetical protein